MSVRRGITLEDALPGDWKELLGTGPLGYGLDLGTTTNKLSNPSSLAVVEQVGLDFVVRLGCRWKTSDPAVTRAMLDRALDLPHGRRPRRLCVDATNERFFAADLRTALAGTVVTELVVASESITYLGETMSTKVYLGSLIVNAADDGHLLLPQTPWMSADLRQPEGSSFMAEVDADGNHADFFSALGHALHALTLGGGPVTAIPTGVGQLAGNTPPKRPGVRGPIGTAIGLAQRLVNV